MKYNSAIYLIPNNPVFNKDTVPEFLSFTKDDTVTFYSNLLLNNKENIEKITIDCERIFCFDDTDKNFTPGFLKAEDKAAYFSNTKDLLQLLKKMSDFFFNNYSNNLIIFANAISISSADIEKALNLLSMEDEAIVVGKCSNNSISFIGFNRFNLALFEEIDFKNLTYDGFLSTICKHNNFVHILEKFLTVTNLEDFKQMYIELSKKESIAYCSNTINENFTHLFIEYKELLK